MTKLLTILLLIPIFLACKNNDKQENPISTKDSTDIVTDNKKADAPGRSDYYEIGEDSITILSFEIEVKLSPKAEERITKGKETIMVDVYFTGTPKDNSGAKLEEDGSFFVASALKEITYGQVAKFENIKFPKKIYDQLADKDIDLGVNVYSGRKSSTDNLLNSDGLFDKISNVVNKKFTIKCKLIYGDD